MTKQTPAALHFMRRLLRVRALAQLKKRPALWHDIAEFHGKTPSTGCSFSDLWVLYSAVRRRRPKEILELGPGLSTVALAHALKANEQGGCPGRITAMEEEEYYLDQAQRLLPQHLERFVDFRLSPRVERNYHLFRGVAYADMPQRNYDFVFVDGPHHRSPVNDDFLFDFDFITVVQQSDTAVYGIVDYRLTTCFVLQTLFGLERVRFDVVRELGFLGPCRKEDLLQLDLAKLTAALTRDARIGRNMRISLR